MFGLNWLPRAPATTFPEGQSLSSQSRLLTCLPLIGLSPFPSGFLLGTVLKCTQLCLASQWPLVY